MNNLKKYYDYGYGDAGGNIENKEVRNRDMAEFMGMRLSAVKDPRFDVLNKLGIEFKVWECDPDNPMFIQWNGREELDFSTDWNWLMSVVEKIESDHKFATCLYVNEWDSRGRYCFSIYRELDEKSTIRKLVIEIATESKIGSVWIAVVEFIKLLNDGKVPTTDAEFDEYYDYLRQVNTELNFESYGRAMKSLFTPNPNQTQKQ